MNIEDIIIYAGVTIFSLGLLSISLISYRKFRNLKLLFVSLVFVVFFLKGLLLSLNLFFEEQIGISSDPLLGVFDLIMLLLLFMATLKR